MIAKEKKQAIIKEFGNARTVRNEIGRAHV